MSSVAACREIRHSLGVYVLLAALAKHGLKFYYHVHGYEFSGYERTIDSHVKNLRHKLGDDPEHPTVIETVVGVGYRLGLCRELDETMRRLGRVFQAGTQQRSEYGGKFRMACEFVRSGGIGKIKLVQGDTQLDPSKASTTALRVLRM